MTKELPDYIIVGAARTGTSWLMKALDEHPEVSIPLRELDYFTENRDRGLEWYKSYFESENKVKVEKSVSYFREECARKIKKVVPNARIIIILRDPVSRAYSQYKLHFSASRIDEDPEEVLTGDSEIVREGLYYMHIQNFLEYFSKEDIHILFFDDFKQDNEQYFEDVCEILGVGDSFTPTILGQKYNPSRKPPRFELMTSAKNRLVRFLHESRLGDKVISWAKKGGLEKVYYDYNDGGDFPPLTEDCRRRLAEFYRSDLKKLQDFLDRDLSHWTPLRSGEDD